MYKLINYDKDKESEILQRLLTLQDLITYTITPFGDFNKSSSLEINKYISWAMDRMFKFQMVIYQILNPLYPPFPYEAKILIRSMLEHSINVQYIHKGNNIFEKEKLIQRFKDYSLNVMPYKDGYDDFCNPNYGLKFKRDEDLNKTQKKYKVILQRDQDKTDFINKVENFRCKYPEGCLSH